MRQQMTDSVTRQRSVMAARGGRSLRQELKHWRGLYLRAANQGGAENWGQVQN